MNNLRNGFHASYFNDWLRFAAIADVTEIRFQPTMLGGHANTNAELVSAARAQIAERAKNPPGS